MRIQVTKHLEVIAVFEVEDWEEITDLAGSITAVVVDDNEAPLPMNGLPLVSIESKTVPYSTDSVVLDD
jgi:hypothetical protein